MCDDINILLMVSYGGSLEWVFRRRRWGTRTPTHNVLRYKYKFVFATMAAFGYAMKHAIVYIKYVPYIEKAHCYLSKHYK